MASTRRTPIGRVAIQHLAALLGDPEAGAEQGLGRGRAEADDQLRIDHGQLRFQPGPAGLDVSHLRRGVDPALAPLGEAEVLDGVGHVHVGHGDVRPRRARAAAPCRPVRRRGCPAGPRRLPAARRPAPAVPAALPAENTTWVAGSHSSQPRHCGAAFRSVGIVGTVGHPGGSSHARCYPAVAVPGRTGPRARRAAVLRPSSLITCSTALIKARWVKACGKLPRCWPVCGSISSP